jgi:hypothetical protein
VVSVGLTLGKRGADVTGRKVDKVLEKPDLELFEELMKYYVEHGGKNVLIKRVVTAATGHPKVSLTIVNAYKILTELGFEVKELKKDD